MESSIPELTTLACPCGADHDIPAGYAGPIVDLVGDQGETIRINLGGDGTWDVPRLYIYLHGLNVARIPEVAVQYGFRCVEPPRWVKAAESATRL